MGRLAVAGGIVLLAVVVGASLALVGDEGSETEEGALTSPPSAPATSVPASVTTDPSLPVGHRNMGETAVAALASGDCMLSPTGDFNANSADFTGSITVIPCRQPFDVHVVADVTMLNPSAVYPGIDEPGVAARRWCGEQMEVYVRHRGIKARFVAVLVPRGGEGAGYQVKCVVLPVGSQFFVGTEAPG